MMPLEILIVEDSPTQAARLVEILRSQDWTTRTARDGRQALAAVAQQRPDLVVSDISMPVMDGLQLCRALKEKKASRDIPVVLLTSLNSTADILAALEAGADFHIPKTCPPAFLMSKIRQVVLAAEANEMVPVSPVELEHGGQTYRIAASREQMLQLLLATYEIAVAENESLIETRRELQDLNDRLQDLVTERTAGLRAEMVAREKSDLIRRHEHMQMRFLTDHVPVMMAHLDAQRRYKFVNQPYAQLFDRSPDALVGRKASEVMDPATYRAVDPHMERVLAGRHDTYDLRLPPNDQELTDVEVSYVPELDKRGKVVGFAAVIVDISERKRAEMELRQAHATAINMTEEAVAARDQSEQASERLRGEVERRLQVEQEIRRLNLELEERVTARTASLQAANRELESFSYSISHDLRTPLRSIAGFSRILLEDCADQLNEDGQGHLQRICSATSRMGQLIDDLLTLSRVNRNELDRESLDLSVLAREIIAELQQEEPDRTVRCMIAPELTVMGDPHLLHAVLTNLLGNAWKFTANTTGAEIEVGVQDAGGEAQYFVRDNGAGFDMAYASKLFIAFQRLHAVAEFPGTGIGLAIVERIITRHGGRIWAEGSVGQGASFYFTLPAE